MTGIYLVRGYLFIAETYHSLLHGLPTYESLAMVSCNGKY